MSHVLRQIEPGLPIGPKTSHCKAARALAVTRDSGVAMSKTCISARLPSCVVALLGPSCARAERSKTSPRYGGDGVTQDGTLVRGKIAKVEAELVTLTGERREDGDRNHPDPITEVKRVTRRNRRDCRTPAATRTPVRAPDDSDDTVFDVVLGSALASEMSRVEEDVNGTLAPAVVIDEVTGFRRARSLPASDEREGFRQSQRPRGTGVCFTRLTVGSVTYDIATTPLFYRAESNKKEDAVKIGVGAAAGAMSARLRVAKKARPLARPSAPAAAPPWCWPPR